MSRNFQSYLVDRKSIFQEINMKSLYENSDEKMVCKCILEVSKEEMFKLQWLNGEKNIQSFKPELDNINFYDEENRQDIQIHDPDLKVVKFVYEYIDLGDSNFGLIFNAELELALTEKMYARLFDEHDGYVDYSCDFKDDSGEAAVPDEDFEFLENSNTHLTLI